MRSKIRTRIMGLTGDIDSSLRWLSCSFLAPQPRMGVHAAVVMVEVLGRDGRRERITHAFV